ncbi:tetraspanin-14 isoform X2 [Boleophthalmus pectinirostris]|uniref:tetraspanin-14 isoform X2 n=1 Tax=Boleophthalmus pectinirostris TaxID=150288 RepID=UPI00242C5CCD|nr:tetraspanin-14 isoform X2 [Boleophthalmus pectinirostris]
MYYYRYENAEVSCCYKYLMFSYNIVFWLLGAALIAAGLWAWSEKGVLQDLSVLTRIHGFDPVWALLVSGAVMFILGFAGCVGALRENLCLLKAFSSMVGLIFLLEVLAVVLVLVFQSQVFDWIQAFFMKNIRAYRDDIDLQNLIDSLQTSTWCCGAQGPDDWEQNPYFSCNSTNASRERCGVPFSCCVLDPAESVLNSQCGYDVRKRSKVRPTLSSDWPSSSLLLLALLSSDWFSSDWPSLLSSSLIGRVPSPLIGCPLLSSDWLSSPLH